MVMMLKEDLDNAIANAISSTLLAQQSEFHTVGIDSWH